MANKRNKQKITPAFARVISFTESEISESPEGPTA